MTGAAPATSASETANVPDEQNDAMEGVEVRQTVSRVVISTSQLTPALREMVQACRSDLCAPQHNIGTDEEPMMVRTDDIFDLKGSDDSQHRPKYLSKRVKEQCVIAV
jgi:hypothetical protein